MSQTLYEESNESYFKDHENVFIIEPLLDPKNKRNSVFPIQHEDIYKFYLVHQSLFWTPYEVDLSEDINHWNNILNDDERYFYEMILAFFAGSDFAVIDKEKKASEEVINYEYGLMINDKITREDVHSISYAMMIEAYITDPIKKERLKNAINEIPTVKKKNDWFKKHIDESDFVSREIAGAITEGIYFSSSFCAIFLLKTRNIMPGLCIYNEFISRDEGIHRDFSTMIYRDHVANKWTKEKIIEIVIEAVEIEIEFCTSALPVKLIGMSSEKMSQYVRYVADKLLIELIGEKYYFDENPFPWMVYISMETVADFFVTRPSAYSKQKNLTNPEDNIIRFNEDY